VEAGVVDAEVVRDLVHHGDGHLVDHLSFGVAHAKQRAAKDRDAVGQDAAVVPAAAGQVETLVQPQQIPLLGAGFVLHQDRHVVEVAHQRARDCLQRVGHQFLETLSRHLHGHTAENMG
jgi:hypothetical protein